MAPAALTAAPIIVVCGLHGGAGTTTIALAIARHAVRETGPGTVLLTETDPRGGGLALALDAAGSYTLADLARHHAAGATPSTNPVVQLPDGIRLLAAAPAEHDQADPDDVAAVLQQAGATHALTVVDAGTLADPHCAGAFQAATSIVWATASHATTGLIAHLLAGPLARPARHLRTVLAVCDLHGDGARPRLEDLRAAAPTAAAIALVPVLRNLSPEQQEHRGIVLDLLRGIAP